MPAQSKILNKKLRSLGRTLLCAEFSWRMVIAIIASILLLASLVTIDALFELPLDARKVLLAIAGTIAGVLLIRALVTPFTQARSTEELALISEKQNPKFDSRLISAVQFASGKASVVGATDSAGDPLVAAMVADTEELASGHNFLNAVDWRFLGRALLVLFGIGTLAIAAFFIWHKVTPALVQRAFLQDVAIPRDTQIVSTTGDQKVGIGDRLTIEATAEGKLPSDGVLRVRFASGRKLDYPLTKSENNKYSVEIEDVPESFTYQVRINDARSGGHEISAFARPEIESVTASQKYPNYTGIDPTEHQPGDFYLFPGSEFTLRLTTTKPLAEATLRLIGLDNDVPIDPTTGTATFEVPSENLTGFSITMTDRDGMDAKEPAVYRAELLGDEPPQVRITYPTRSDELVTKTARSLVAFEATDRFGIASVYLNFMVNDAEQQSIELELEESEKPPTSLRNQYDWELKQVEPPLKEGDVVEYWITAQDRQAVTPGIGESEHLRLRVVSVAEKRQDLLSRASDFLGGVGATTEDQERLNNDLGALIKAKAKAKE